LSGGNLQLLQRSQYAVLAPTLVNDCRLAPADFVHDAELVHLKRE
jgi:hypothetical protein